MTYTGSTDTLNLSTILEVGSKIGVNCTPTYEIQIGTASTTDQNNELRIYGYDGSNTKFGRAYISAQGDFILSAEEVLALSAGDHIQLGDNTNVIGTLGVTG